MTHAMSKLIGQREAFDHSLQLAKDDYDNEVAADLATSRTIAAAQARWDRALKCLTDTEQAVFTQREKEGPQWPFLTD